ncbi:MAG: methionyl-tRNA formyltransferase [Actinomycetota bacterium]|nr:methionyl-tRNA formyltransferase [Actinomycetota bacterium]
MTVRTLFFGTPAWAVPSFEALLASDLDVVGAVTNPDRPAGRGMNVVHPPVQIAAAAAGVPVLQPPSARTDEFADVVREITPDVAAVVAYGKILPRALLEIPRYGFVNLHFSLLPEYRGAAPVQRAVMDGKKRTGASTMLLTEGMDEGPVLGSIAVDIDANESAGALGERLAALGAPLLVDSISGYVEGRIEARPQDDSLATYAPKITEEEARIDWGRSVASLSCFVRGLDPSPGAWTTLNGKRLRVFRIHPIPFDERGDLKPGDVVVHKDIVAGCGDGAAVVQEAQLEGKRRMTGRELANGLRVTADQRFE